MRIAINAISATAGGARTYLVNLVRVLPPLGAHEYLLYVPSSLPPEIANLPPNLQTVACPVAGASYVARFWWEQFVLPAEAKRWGASVLVCVGNFCPFRSPVPVLLLSRNALYFSPRYQEDLLERGHYGWALRHALMSRLALGSARAARLTVTPTQAMGAMIRAAGRGRVGPLRVIPHGLQAWPPRNGHASGATDGPPPFRFLVASHYNYFRNFETVFRAMARLQSAGSPAKLILSTDLRPGLRLGGYDTTRAAQLLDHLGIRPMVTMAGAVDYDHMPALYRSAHAVICPGYAESFSLTVLEAMAMGVPVIASDIAAHREVAGDAALLFSPLDPEDLARQCESLISDDALRERLRAAGLERAQCFSWRRHFEQLLAAAAEIADTALTT